MPPPGFFANIDSWDAFTARAAMWSERERGTAFEHLVRHHLRFDPKYRTKLAEVWFHHEVPADLRARLNFPSRDEGIRDCSYQGSRLGWLCRWDRPSRLSPAANRFREPTKIAPLT